MTVVYEPVRPSEQKSPAIQHAEVGGNSLQSWRQRSGWRLIILAGLLITSIVLIINVAVLAWAGVAHSDNQLFKGDCRQARSIVTWASLAINALSTLLLGASNAAMQCLCAPTRLQVDRAHAAGSWMDIGVSGINNFRSMERWRKIAWAAILISSLPLHLLYNSVIFSTSQANSYVALAVTEDFLTEKPASLVPSDSLSQPLLLQIRGSLLSDDLSTPEVWTIADSLQKNVTNLKRLENADCIRTYGTDYVTSFSNVLVVTNGSSPSNGSAFASIQYYPASGFNGLNIASYTWVCNGEDSFSVPCNPAAEIQQSNSWTITVNNTKIPVSHCLAQPVLEQCTVQILPPMLAIVVACNAFKIICFAVLLFKPRFHPLMIIGDAVASFMVSPDPSAITYGPVTAETLRKMYLADPLHFSTERNSRAWRSNPSRHQWRAWHVHHRRWASAVGPKRWAITVAGFLILWCIGLGFLCMERSSGASLSDFSTGFGAAYAIYSLRTARSWPIIGAVLVANIPQILLSFIYFAYNDVCTCMLASVAFIRYSLRHRGLRVTRRSGEQRSAHTLSLPLKVSVPLLVAAGLLHWAMSQSFFLSRVEVIDPMNEVDADRSLTLLGWSAPALLLLLLIWGLMLVIVLGCGCIPFRTTAPPVGSNSRAILCASGTIGDGAAEALRKVRYGVIGTTREGYQRVGFSSGEVEPLVDGDLYG